MSELSNSKDQALFREKLIKANEDLMTALKEEMSKQTISKLQKAQYNIDIIHVDNKVKLLKKELSYWNERVKMWENTVKNQAIEANDNYENLLILASSFKSNKSVEEAISFAKSSKNKGQEEKNKAYFNLKYHVDHAQKQAN